MPTPSQQADLTDESDLSRFVTAQDDGGTYSAALAELQAGRKRSHWMWFVFPQVAGLGQSPTARHYAIAGCAHARAYLAHPVLGPRLLECAGTLSALPGHDPVAVLGSVDAMKLRSSMTLFGHVANPERMDAAVFRLVLDKYFSGEQDPETLRLLDSAHP